MTNTPQADSTVDGRMDRAKQPGSLLAGPYGHPIHPVLVTLPIGAWVASVVFDIASSLVEGDSGLRQGAALLIGIGLAGAVLATIVGFLDFSRLTPRTRAHKIALAHMVINLGAILVFAIDLGVRLVKGVEEPSILAILLSVVGLALLGSSGFLGGELVFRYGVRAAAETTQRKGFDRGSSRTERQQQSERRGFDPDPDITTDRDGTLKENPSGQLYRADQGGES